MAKKDSKKKKILRKRKGKKDASDVFSRYDTHISDYTGKHTVRSVTDEKKLEEPHTVRLPKGAVPYHGATGSYQRLANQVFGKVAERYLRKKGEVPLEQTLLKAHMKVDLEDFYAFAWMNTLLITIISIAVTAIGVPLLFSMEFATWMALLPALSLAAIPGAYLGSFYYPKSVAKGRAKDIDTRISYAMSFVSTMASADVNIDVIFKELSRQEIYGEIQKEAQWITRDVDILGKDVLTAIRDAANRTPSLKLQDFLQGVVTTTLSGGHLKPYFMLKTEQFGKEAKMEQRRSMETLGMLAESFVTVVVAMPLFLIVMMSLMGMVGGGGSSVTFLYLIVYLMIPLSQVGFIVVLQSMAEEV